MYDIQTRSCVILYVWRFYSITRKKGMVKKLFVQHTEQFKLHKNDNIL